jgi:hypothetical protein
MTAAGDAGLLGEFAEGGVEQARLDGARVIGRTDSHRPPRVI